MFIIYQIFFFISKDYVTVQDLSKKQATELANLSSELKQLQFLHESTSKDSQVELKCKLDMLNKDLNSKWSQRLRDELEALRKELKESMELEKRDEIAMLNELKDGELKNLKTVWQTKTNELLEEISRLKRELGEKEDDIKAKFDELKTSLETENKSLTEKIEQLNAEHASKVEKMKTLNENATSSLLDNLMKESQEKVWKFTNNCIKYYKLFGIYSASHN